MGGKEIDTRPRGKRYGDNEHMRKDETKQRKHNAALKKKECHCGGTEEEDVLLCVLPFMMVGVGVWLPSTDCILLEHVESGRG